MDNLACVFSDGHVFGLLLIWSGELVADVPQHVPLIRLQEERCRILVGVVPVNLTPSEFRILRTLMSQPGRVYGRAELLAERSDADPRVVDAHVRSVRNKIRKAGGGERIETACGFGYSFSPEGKS